MIWVPRDSFWVAQLGLGLRTGSAVAEAGEPEPNAEGGLELLVGEAELNAAGPFEVPGSETVAYGLARKALLDRSLATMPWPPRARHIRGGIMVVVWYSQTTPKWSGWTVRFGCRLLNPRSRRAER